jgi:hypothetical protein
MAGVGGTGRARVVDFVVNSINLVNITVNGAITSIWSLGLRFERFLTGSKGLVLGVS